MIITAYIGSSNIAKDLIAEAVNMIAFVKRDPEIGAKQLELKLKGRKMTFMKQKAFRY